MSLIDKLQTGKRKVLAGIVAGAIGVSLITGYSGCRDSKDNYVQDTAVPVEVYSPSKKSEQEYSFEDFEKVLGDRVIPEREVELREFWEGYNNIDKKLICEAFNKKSDPKSYYERFKEFLPETFLEGYDKFNKQINKANQTDFKHVPWRVKDKEGSISETDKLGIYISGGLSVKYSNINFF